MLMSLLTVILTAPMLAVAALGLPLLITLCVCGARLLKKAPRVKKEHVREAMQRRGIAHLVAVFLALVMIPVSMITSISVYACAAGAAVMALGGIVLGAMALRYRASHTGAILEIIFGALFAVILAAALIIVQVKLHIAIF